MRSLPRLLLALSCCLPAPSLWAVDDLTRLLEVMGLQDVFVELQPLVEAQLQQAGTALDAPAAAALREALAPGRMQAALERTLRIDVAPGLSREALESLSQGMVARVEQRQTWASPALAGAIRMARDLGPGHTIVTILCDYGTRYQSKIFDSGFLRSRGLPAPDWLETQRGGLPDVTAG